ncbi:hypothetical protein DQ04_01241080 [Trypanosoma grayi]|uniref:hypothetical protein n=1 Tax=Trypanosoma grayi TaxID=71804 RepID=UPI0004F46B88|nr:hypothetical protein DQ04_01241080 [Trypanosoma grayi]KEG13053.1 hypothetical protein DQ04_01241080 [Trypanosoma grayi]
MLSQQAGSVAPPCALEDTIDPAAMLCAFLMAKRSWSRSRIALTLGVPPLVVEECIRNGVSSVALRSQLALWVSEARDDDTVPPDLAKAVVEATASVSASASVTEALQDADPFFALDPVTRAHFADLGANVGQSFISILNDPQETTETSNWGAWFGSVVSSALDYKGSAKCTETAVGSESSSEALLSSYNLQDDYAAYLQLVSAPYNQNREEGRLAAIAADTNTRLGSSTTTTATATTTALSLENLPWPVGTPKEFFDSSYDSASEFCFMEQELQKNKGISGDESDNAIIAMESFGEDFKVMESRMKELRQWESAVEGCLLRHVQSRSDQFFSASHEFGDRAAEARETLDNLQQTRDDVGVFGRSLVREMMRIARHYRTRNSLSSLCALMEMVMAVSSQVAAVENWVALPERDMMELPVVVESYCSLQDAIMAENVSETKTSSGGGITSDASGLLTRVVALRDVPRRVARVKERLCTMIMGEVEATLVPSVRGAFEDGYVACVFLSAVGMGIWSVALEQSRILLIDALWMNVREAFIAFMMGNSALSDETANALLSTAVVSHSSRDEKLALLSHSNVCRFPLFMQLVGSLVDQILDFVCQAAQRWGLLLVESSSRKKLWNGDGTNMEDMTKKYLSSLCAAAEGNIALLLEVRSQRGKAPANVHDLEMLVSLGYSFMSNMVSGFQGVLAICGDIEDPWKYVSGKQLKAAVTHLAKEHFRCHHMESIEKLRVTIENETWQHEGIDVVFQSCVDTLCRSDSAVIAELRGRSAFTDVTSDIRLICSLPKSAEAVATSMVTRGKTTDKCETPTRKQLMLPLVNGHSEGRIVSGSLLLLIEMLHENDVYLGRFHFLAFDVMGKMYDLLKLYVSQCAALLLGAMAVENGVLQTITIQHMAVASQNLAFLYEGIPLMTRRWLLVTSDDKLSPSISEDMERVRRDCATYRCELFEKISALVKDKVYGLGTVTSECWRDSGNEWVMTMLRETARLMRALKPLLPPRDCRGIVVPLLGTFARMIRAVTLSLGQDADLRTVMVSDVLLFKANVERFGFDVLRCAALYKSPLEAMTDSVEPHTSEKDVVTWFFGDNELSSF